MYALGKNLQLKTINFTYTDHMAFIYLSKLRQSYNDIILKVSEIPTYSPVLNHLCASPLTVVDSTDVLRMSSDIRT